MKIDSYTFGTIVINGKEYNSDVIIYPNRVNASWWRKSGHNICIEDLHDILASRPEILILGKGTPGLMQVPEEIIKELASRGIKVISLPTTEAVDKYNSLSDENHVVAGLHLTC